MQMPSTQSLPPAWRRYRLLRNSFQASFVAWVVVMAIVITDALVDPAQYLIGHYWWLGAPILLWGIIANHLYKAWPCPRCGQSYFKKSIWSVDISVDDCVHCGLAKWADPANP